MATRNLTSRFDHFRTQAKHRQAARAHPASDDPDLQDSGAHSAALLHKGETSDSVDAVSIKVGLAHALPPEWVDIVDTLHKDSKTIKDNLAALEKLHAARLKVSFDKDEAEQERDIEILTQEITRLLRKCETSLKRIAVVGNAPGTHLPQQERVVRLNVMRNFGAELHQLSVSFRKSQKDFMLSLKGREEMGSDFFKDDTESKQPLSLEEAAERGLTQNQMLQLQEQEKSADDRQKEIIHIAKSIHELATIFRELSVLVIEQGTILDRIDYNIEQTLHKVTAGVGELEIANEYSKKARTLKCILAMLLLVIILVGILVIKQTRK